MEILYACTVFVPASSVQPASSPWVCLELLDVKFAFVNGQRLEAQPGISGECPACAHPMIAKCGEQRQWHWSHRGKRHCDPWWENEGEWHLAWKAAFPDDWCEIVHASDDGTKHIADIRTAHGWVIEFQHSYIAPDERRSRDAFYRQLVWVVDGTRRKRDLKQFVAAWNDGIPTNRASIIRRLHAEDCNLLREWADTQGPIFLDFGAGQPLCWLLPGRLNGGIYAAVFRREVFIHILRTDVVQNGLNFAGLVKEFGDLVRAYETSLRR